MYDCSMFLLQVYQHNCPAVFHDPDFSDHQCFCRSRLRANHFSKYTNLIAVLVATSKITTKEPPFGILISTLSPSNTTTAATFQAVSARPVLTRTRYETKEIQ